MAPHFRELDCLQQPAKPPVPSLRRKPGERVLSNPAQEHPPAAAHCRDEAAPAPPKTGLSLQPPPGQYRPGRSAHKAAKDRAPAGCPA